MVSLDLGWRNEVLSIDFSPSLEISLVTNNTRFRVSIQKPAETRRIITALQNVERSTTLSKIVWLLEIFLLEEKHQILLAHFEYALLGNSRSLLKLAK